MKDNKIDLTNPLKHLGLERIRMEEDDRYSWVYYAGTVEKVIEKLNAKILELESMPHTDNSAVIDLLSSELEKLRPMETALEIAEADNKKYIARIKELEKEISETHKSYKALLNERNKLAHELHTIKKTITEI